MHIDINILRLYVSVSFQVLMRLSLVRATQLFHLLSILEPSLPSPPCPRTTTWTTSWTAKRAPWRRTPPTTTRRRRSPSCSTVPNTTIRTIITAPATTTRTATTLPATTDLCSTANNYMALIDHFQQSNQFKLMFLHVVK